MKLPEDRMDIQALVQAFTNYIEAKAEHDKAFEEYEGYSWGYHGNREINRMNEAAANLGKYLDGYVEQRIAAAMAKGWDQSTENGQ